VGEPCCNEPMGNCNTADLSCVNKQCFACGGAQQPACPPTWTPTATVTQTPTVTETPTVTPTPKPNGAACNTGSVCASTFCVDGVCCDTACSGPQERCDLRDGTCLDTGAPAPLLSTHGLVIAGLTLCAVAALALARRRWRA